MTTLAPSESKRLQELEIVIETGKQTFVAVGNALAEIRDGTLYRKTHSSFEDYCKEKWGFRRDFADKLVRAAEVVSTIPEKLHTIVCTETHARALSKAPVQKRPDVIERAQEMAGEKKVTAKHIAKACEEVRDATMPTTLPKVEFSPESEARIAEAQKDTDVLWRLKEAWRKATKKDKSAFLTWIEANK